MLRKYFHAGNQTIISTVSTYNKNYVNIDYREIEISSKYPICQILVRAILFVFIPDEIEMIRVQIILLLQNKACQTKLKPHIDTNFQIYFESPDDEAGGYLITATLHI